MRMQAMPDMQPIETVDQLLGKIDSDTDIRRESEQLQAALIAIKFAQQFTYFGGHIIQLNKMEEDLRTRLTKVHMLEG